MAGRTTFAKLQREKAKKAKAEAKRRARSGDVPVVEVEEPTPEPVDAGSSTKPPSPQELLILVERLQSDYDNGRIDDEEYEEQKMLLFERVNAG
jgi:hypothetical protein